MNWTQEEHDWFAQNYGKVSQQELEEHLGRNIKAIRNYACRHNISIKPPRWTAEDDRYLETHLSQKSYESIAKNLGRSIKAVYSRTYMHDLGYKCEQSDALHLAEAARMIGISKDALRYHVTAKHLKSRRIGGYRMIRPQDLHEWMQEHPKCWKAMNCEQWYFDDLPWFHEKLLQERHEKFDKVG